MCVYINMYIYICVYINMDIYKCLYICKPAHWPNG